MVSSTLLFEKDVCVDFKKYDHLLVVVAFVTHAVGETFLTVLRFTLATEPCFATVFAKSSPTVLTLVKGWTSLISTGEFLAIETGTTVTTAETTSAPSCATPVALGATI